MKGPLKPSFLALMFLVFSPPGFSQSAPGTNWMADFSLYPYQSQIKDDVDFSFTVNGKISDRLSYFSFNNFVGVTGSGGPYFDRTEQNLRYHAWNKLPVDIVVQGVYARGELDDFVQAGLGWRLEDTPGWAPTFAALGLSYRITFHFLRAGADDPGAMVMEHFFLMRFPRISDRLYLRGIIDQTFNADLPPVFPSNPIYGEVQLGARVWKDIYLIAEYRKNQMNPGNENNLAAGVEFKARF